VVDTLNVSVPLWHVAVTEERARVTHKNIILHVYILHLCTCDEAERDAMCALFIIQRREPGRVTQLGARTCDIELEDSTVPRNVPSLATRRQQFISAHPSAIPLRLYYADDICVCQLHSLMHSQLPVGSSVTFVARAERLYGGQGLNRNPVHCAQFSLSGPGESISIADFLGQVH